MKCNKCGAEIEEGAKFCGNCGNKIESQVEMVVEQQVIEPTNVITEESPETISQLKEEPKKKKGKIGIILLIVLMLIGIGVAFVLLVLPKIKKIEYRDAYKEIVAIGNEINNSFSNDYCGKVVSYEKATYYTQDEYIPYIEKCKNNYGIALLPEVEKLGKTDAVKRDKEIKEQYDKFKAEYDKIHDKATDLETKLDEYQNMHKFKYETKELYFSNLTNDDIDTLASYLEKSSIDEVKSYVAEWKEKLLAHVLVMRDSDSDLHNMLANYLTWDHSAEWQARFDTSYPAYKAVLEKEPTIGKLYPLETMNYYNLKQEYKTLRTLIATKYQENYKFGTNDCSEKDNTVVCE